MPSFNVIEEFQTIREIISKKASIARFGDGEFKLCLGRKQVSQIPSEKIKARLIAVLNSDIPNLFIGIPRIFKPTGVVLSKKKEQFWSNYRKKRITKYLKAGKKYYSAFITRPDSAWHIDVPEYWNLCKEMWRNRNVILVKGEANSFDKNQSDIFSTAKSVKNFFAPKTNAFQSYEDIFRGLCFNNRNALFVISLGPTATILAHDLCLMGFQALDLGHMGLMYSKAHHYYQRGENFY